jgi:hypothetical protein
MASRALTGVVLLTVILMSTVSPAEACALWCVGSHGGGHRHDQPMLTAGTIHGHHHDRSGMQHLQSPVGVTAAICRTNCSVTPGNAAKFVPRERSGGRVILRELGGGELRVTESDGNVVMHFEIAGPPGPAGFTVAILRV